MIARRKFILAGATLALAREMVGKASAQQKLSKQDAGYQDKPKNGQLCAGCTLFQPPNACNVVAGEINPQGWCKLFEKPPE
jgi:hypothetical protein